MLEQLHSLQASMGQVLSKPESSPVHVRFGSPAVKVRYGPPTHALLLAFKHSDTANDIELLRDAMREILGWKAYVYWIDGRDMQTAQDRLQNVVYSLESRVQHEDEKLVIYYEGHGWQPIRGAPSLWHE